ncbi:MAG: rhodanese-like domain-containing protein [Chloroflexi bacterium]|nr:rhodanese-like domain-containing protein [Chloroflexota bacterium]
MIMRIQQVIHYLLLIAVLMLAGLLAACGTTAMPFTASGQNASAKPAPNFPDDGKRYVNIDLVKKEYDRGADFVLLDARPKPNYNLDHIKNAVNLPFNEMADRYKELPKDKWVVAYCACPRSEADYAADILGQKGYTKVKVLYEGYVEWQTRGYPVDKSSRTSQ